MTIYKGTVSLTFLFDSNIDSVEFVRGLTLDQILANCDTEHMLGKVGDLTIEEVPNDNVPAEEIAMGSDGEFFADPDELEHARLDAEVGCDGEDGERPDRPCDPGCARRLHPAAECDCSRSQE